MPKPTAPLASHLGLWLRYVSNHVSARFAELLAGHEVTVSEWVALRTLIGQARITGPRVHDARVAALCLSHAVRELWTSDRDFSMFPALRVRNPLVG